MAEHSPLAKPTSKHVRLPLVVATFLCASAALAQGIPTVDEVVRNLSNRTPATQAAEPAPSAGEKTRGWTVREHDSSAKKAMAAADPKRAAKRAGYSETRIQFEFGSDQLTAQTLQVLDVFATAITTPELSGARFVIEGHTDGIGSDAYNLDLSRRRAEAVIRYLVEKRGIDPKRLSPVGKGKSELAVHGDPAAAANRRVVWITSN